MIDGSFFKQFDDLVDFEDRFEIKVFVEFEEESQVHMRFFEYLLFVKDNVSTAVVIKHICIVSNDEILLNTFLYLILYRRFIYNRLGLIFLYLILIYLFYLIYLLRLLLVK